MSQRKANGALILQQILYFEMLEITLYSNGRSALIKCLFKSDQALNLMAGLLREKKGTNPQYYHPSHEILFKLKLSTLVSFIFSLP